MDGLGEDCPLVHMTVYASSMRHDDVEPRTTEKKCRSGDCLYQGEGLGTLLS